MQQYHYEGPNKVFKVHIYNAEVRAKLKQNDAHDFFSDQWAEGQFILVQAAGRDELKEIIVNRYPPKDGFVIESTIEVN